MRLRACVAGVMTAALFAAPANAGTWWQPTPGTTWQIQFSGALDTADYNVQAFDVDMFDTSVQHVEDIHAKPAKAICYIDAGSWENWRPDASKYPKRVLGRALTGWAGERWLDIRRIGVIGPILGARADDCAAKGFDAVDFDNVDGYANNTGFPLTAADQIRFNRFIANLAHNAGLAVGLKNDLGQVRRLEPSFDFAVNEQCVQYKECGRLKPFVDAGKAVFNIEYRGNMTAICVVTRPLQLSTLKKHLSLDAYSEVCPP